MHDHSEKIQPKKLVTTIILAILLLSYAYVTRNERSGNNENRVNQQTSQLNATTTQ